MRTFVMAAVAVLILSAAAAATPTLAQSNTAITVGIDTDATGNQALSLGAIDGCRLVQQGDTFQVDVFAKGIPAPSGFFDGISGFAFNFKYDPNVINVTAIDANLMLAGGGTRDPFEVTNPLPDTDGNFRADEADLSQRFESGDGVLARLTLLAVGPGVSPLTLGDDASSDADGIPDVLGAAGRPQYNISEIDNAEIGVGQACSAPTPVIPVTPSPGPGGTIAPSEPANGGGETGSHAPGGSGPTAAGETPRPTVAVQTPPSSGSGLSTGAIIGIVAGGIAGATALGAAAWYALRRSRTS